MEIVEAVVVLAALAIVQICILLPVTVVFIGCVFFVGRRNQVPVTYYTNLLISNIIQCTQIICVMAKVYENFIHIYCGLMAGLYFKMCMALERYFFIACPLLDCLRQTQCSVLFCVLVWSFCIVSVSLAVVLHESVRLIIYAALPAPLFIFCLAGTLKALPAATSVPTEEKQRIVGMLVWLLLNYFLINLPLVILLTLSLYPDVHVTAPIYSMAILYLLSPFLDLILFAFKCKGPIDRLLACVCCCSMEDISKADVTDVSTERRVHVVGDKRREQTHDGRDEELE